MAKVRMQYFEEVGLIILYIFMIVVVFYNYAIFIVIILIKVIKKSSLDNFLIFVKSNLI